MKQPTPLTRALNLLLLSLSLSLANTAFAKEKKQSAALQCEQDGVLSPCPDSKALSGKTAKANTFKAQADELTDKPQKKKKGKKTGGKKSKRTKPAEE
ncbi:MAG: hypothetical protein EXR37_01125 [Limnohabitans sp.]|nr:hypothetical protein [Limnohabitans sp.]